jgi:transposase-like protein
MAKDGGYSAEMKAAVMAALLTGQSVSSVAREYHLPKGTVSSWKKRSPEVATVATPRDAKRAAADTAEHAEVGALLMQYLQAALRTLKTQVEVFGDKDWLKKQPASEAAVLHGVLADKTIRLLEATAPPDPGPEDHA